MSLRSRLLLLVVITLLPAFALILYSGLEQRSRIAADAQAEALRLARLASVDQARQIDSARQLLAVLSMLPEVRSDDKAACSRLFADLLENYSFASNLGVIDPNGDLVCSALPVASPVNLSDRSYFIQAMETGEFSVGEYQIGRVTGTASINFGHPIVNASGAIDGVVFVAVSLEWLGEVNPISELPSGSTVAVIDRNGTILARYPDPDAWVGLSLPEAPLRETILSLGGEGSAEAPGLDGIERLYGFAPLSAPASGAVTVVIGIPSQMAFAGVDLALRRDLLGLVVLLLLAGGVAWLGSDLLVLRRVNRLITAAGRLSGGDLRARTGLAAEGDEIGQLARTLDSMAASIEQREERRLDVEEALRESELKFRTLAEASLVGVYIMQDGRYRYVNPTMAAMFGYEPEEMVGRLGPKSIAHPEDSLLVWERHRQSMEGEVEVARYAFRGLRKDGSIVHCETFGRAHQFEGRPAILGTMLDITERQAFEEKIQSQLQRLSALRAIDLAITSSLDPSVTFEVLLRQITVQLGVDAAAILLYHRETRTLTFAAGRGFRTDALRFTSLRMGEGLAGRAGLDRRVISVPDLAAESSVLDSAPLLREEGFVSYSAAPLLAKGSIRGVLEVFSRTPLTPDQAWLDFLEALAGQAAIAIDNSTLFEELHQINLELVRAYDTTLEGWSKALELRDQETEGHSQRVTDITLRLARKLGMPENDLFEVRRGALLHDIGKMGIPDSILFKPGPLSELEWEVMRMHPVYAYELLVPIHYLRSALDIPYCHHEKWDGTGYPRGLVGEAIPLPARIFAVVDVWDALGSDRPYRTAWPENRVLQYLHDQAGLHFDPAVVKAFLNGSL